MSTPSTADQSPSAPAGRTGDGTVLRCAVVLFDCDGVLVDSDAVIVESWIRWADQMSLDPARILATMHGRRSQDTIAEFVEPDRRAEALALIDAIEVADADAVTAIPGAAELLASLPVGRWAVVTSGSPDLVRARLTAVGLPVPDALITAKDVSQGKPDPEGYLAAARLLGVPPHECIVVEDAPAGVQAARAANVRHVVGVGNRDLSAHRPDVTVPDLRPVRWTGDGLGIR